MPHWPDPTTFLGMASRRAVAERLIIAGSAVFGIVLLLSQQWPSW